MTASLEDMSATCWTLRSALDDAKHARLPDAQLREAARAYIEAVYAYQMAKYGKVRQKLSIGAILR